ncbi:glucoamylase family protein [Fodinibius sp. SL11]|uniref:glucoamylase family protein n=1 Tax=Fodinibius sp. SL11 TaxID=3425690 RepID=UPI003F880400
MATINVTKASGEQEPFNEAKLRRMLVATGADSKVIDQVIKAIEDKLYDGISTQRITEEAFRQLPKKSENIRFDKIPTEHEPPSDFDSERLDRLQRHAFDYFLHETNPNNGLVADNSQLGAPASIASVGFSLGAYVVGVERDWISRREAIQRTLSTLRFFWTSEQSPAPSATGHKGFYYHFLDMKTGKRAGKCELSTIDTGILLAGMLLAAAFFDRDTKQEQEIRTLADDIYRRVNWKWACNGKATITHGWTPKDGFLPYRWEGYDEAGLLYFLALGSPSQPLSKESYKAWTSTYEWKKIYGYEFIYGGPLFIHQYSHIWIDFRGIQDDFMREKGIDYFENSRRATYIQQEYAIRNPLDFKGYGKNFWGITASDGPGWSTKKVNGIERSFFGYIARGAPYGPDDGTVAPWAVLTSLPFAPEIVLPTIQNFQDVYPQITGKYCLRCSFNLSYPNGKNTSNGWTSSYHYGINLGPVILMIENYRSELIWKLIRSSSHIVKGLKKAGLRSGWL